MHPFDIETWLDQPVGMNPGINPDAWFDPRYVFERAFKVCTAVVSMKGMADASIHRDFWYRISAEMIWNDGTWFLSRYHVILSYTKNIISGDIWWSKETNSSHGFTDFKSWTHIIQQPSDWNYNANQFFSILQFQLLTWSLIKSQAKSSMQSYRLLYKAVKRNHQKILFFNPFLQTLNLSIHCLGEACKQLILALVLDLLQTVMQNFKQCHIHSFQFFNGKVARFQVLKRLKQIKIPAVLYHSLSISHVQCVQWPYSHSFNSLNPVASLWELLGFPALA